MRKEIEKKEEVKMKTKIFLIFLSVILIFSLILYEKIQKKRKEFTFEKFLEIMSRDIDSGIFEYKEKKIDKKEVR